MANITLFTVLGAIFLMIVFGILQTIMAYIKDVLIESLDGLHKSLTNEVTLTHKIHEQDDEIKKLKAIVAELTDYVYGE